MFKESRSGHLKTGSSHQLSTANITDILEFIHYIICYITKYGKSLIDNVATFIPAFNHECLIFKRLELLKVLTLIL